MGRAIDSIKSRYDITDSDISILDKSYRVELLAPIDQEISEYSELYRDMGIITIEQWADIRGEKSTYKKLRLFLNFIRKNSGILPEKI